MICFAVVAGIQPSVRDPGWQCEACPTSRIKGSVKIDGIGSHGDVSDAVAVPDEMLHQTWLDRSGHAIALDPAAFQVRRVDGQDVAFVLAGGKSHPSVLRVGGRMRAPVHPDGSIGRPPVTIAWRSNLMAISFSVYGSLSSKIR